MLTKDEILLLLNRLAQRVVVAPSADFPFSVVAAHGAIGYSDDPVIGPLQAKLSIMLEMVTRKPVRL